MTLKPERSKALLYTIAGIGILIQCSAIVLMLVWDTSPALVAPLMIVGMFMSFAPAIANKAAPRK